MMLSEPNSLTNVDVVLVTSNTNDGNWGKQTAWQHLPDTELIYMQACNAISKNVYSMSFDTLFEKESFDKFRDSYGLIVDLTGGFYELDKIGLTSSIASGLDMICFPATTKHYVLTHDKLIGKFIAENASFRVAKTLKHNELENFDKAVIKKPVCGGDSFGITKINKWSNKHTVPFGYFVEEFIEGLDSTVHLIRNDDLQTYTVLDHLIASNSADAWFDKTSKENSNRIFTTLGQSINRESFDGELSSDLKRNIETLLSMSGHPFLARIDFRQLKSSGILNSADVVFLEVNVAPTISHANDWYNGIEQNYRGHYFFKAVENMPIHPAAKSLAFMFQKLYVQSLSMQGNNPVLLQN